MSAVAQKDEYKFKEDLTDLSDKIKKAAVVDAASGTVTIPEDFFFANAPEAVTEEAYKAVRTYTDLFSNAATKATTELAVPLFKKHKELAQVLGTATLWKKDTFESVVKRDGSNRDFKTGDQVPYKGALSVGRVNVASTRSKAEYTAIKHNLKSLAEAAGL